MAKKRKKKKKKAQPEDAPSPVQADGLPARDEGMKELEEVDAAEVEMLLDDIPKSKYTPAEDEYKDLRKRSVERDEFFEALQRTTADFENYQKRIARDKKTWSEATLRSFLSQILGPINDFDRAIAGGPGEGEAEKLFEGFKLIHTNLWNVLEAAGLVQIEANGTPFDPLFHEAVFMEESDEYDRPTVVEVLEGGYMLGAQVIRHAKVKVSKPPVTPTEDEGATTDSEKPAGDAKKDDKTAAE